MVDVTSHNFAALRPEIEAHLRSALFVAIDTEFTGLLSDERYSNTWFDGSQERYRKLRSNFNQIAINQLGLAICTAASSSSPCHYTCHVYNVYVRCHVFLDSDTSLLCQASALEFLATHGFDFNTWLYSGVPGLTRQQREAALQQLHLMGETARNSYRTGEVRDAVRGVVDWSCGAACGDCYVVPEGVNSSADVAPPGAPTQYRDPSFAPALIATLHGACSDLHAAIEDDGLVMVRKLSPDQRVRLEPVVRAEWQRLSDSTVQWITGCSHLLWMIAQLNIPVVLHNGLIDLMLIYKQFFGPLPPSLSQFKRALREELPLVYDTKLLTRQVRSEHRDNDAVWLCLSESSLQSVSAALQRCEVALYRPGLYILPQDNKYAGRECPHEAGYDAFLTARCFLQLSHLHFSLNTPSSVPKRPLEPREHMASLKHLANKINMMRAAVLYVDLAGTDPLSTRPPWIVVERLPPWRAAFQRPVEDAVELDQQQATASTLGAAPSAAATPGGVLDSSKDRNGKSASQDQDRNSKLPPSLTLSAIPQFSPECVSALLSRFGSVDVRPWRPNKLLVATASFETHRLILSSVRVTGVRTYPYSPYRHSRLARGAMWSGLLASGGLSALLFYSIFR